MSEKLVVHAAKIPEGLQLRSKDRRQKAGDMTYVNVCDGRPWRSVPERVSCSEVVACEWCAGWVALARQQDVSGPRR